MRKDVQLFWFFLHNCMFEACIQSERRCSSMVTNQNSHTCSCQPTARWYSFLLSWCNPVAELPSSHLPPSLNPTLIIWLTWWNHDDETHSKDEEVLLPNQVLQLWIRIALWLCIYQPSIWSIYLHLNSGLSNITYVPLVLHETCWH